MCKRGTKRKSRLIYLKRNCEYFLLIDSLSKKLLLLLLLLFSILYYIALFLFCFCVFVLFFVFYSFLCAGFIIDTPASLQVNKYQLK
jgi:hypothetical protein